MRLARGLMLLGLLVPGLAMWGKAAAQANARPALPGSVRRGNVGDMPLAVRLVTARVQLSAREAGRYTFRDTHELPASGTAVLRLETSAAFPAGGKVEVALGDGVPRELTRTPGGGLTLEGSETVLATLEPAAVFGEDAAGELRVRVVDPTPRAPAIHDEHEPPSSVRAEEEAATTPATGPDRREMRGEETAWIDVGKVVRLPEIMELRCARSGSEGCVLRGARLARLLSIAAEGPGQEPLMVAANFAGGAMRIPSSPGGMYAVRLRDDPTGVVTMKLPVRR